SEIFGEEAPRLGAVNLRAAADAHGVVVVAVADGVYHAAFGIDAGMAFEGGAHAVAVKREAMIAEVVARDLVEGVMLAALQEEDGLTDLSEEAGDDVPRSAGANDDHVHICVQGLNPTICQEMHFGLPPLPGSP